MDQADFVQVALSAGALSVLTALAAWLKIAQPTPPLDEARVRQLLAEAFPGRVVEAVWVGAAGKGALAKSGAAALVVCAVRDGFACRKMPWALALSVAFKTGRLLVDLTDIDAPVAILSLAVDPPGSLPRAA